MGKLSIKNFSDYDLKRKMMLYNRFVNQKHIISHVNSFKTIQKGWIYFLLI